MTLVSVSVGSFPDMASAAAPGAKLWAKRYNGPANSYDHATALGVSPDGSQVFVTGVSFGSTSGADYATVAYDASTGAELWARRYNGAGNDNDFTNALGVSPDGSEVFVTGMSAGSTRGSDYATVAYDASTGATLWVKRFDGPRNRRDNAGALGVSPDGSQVFVTGSSWRSTRMDDYATVAYDASTGAELWAKRYNGPRSGSDNASALGVSPDGSQVFVTGESSASTNEYDGDYATVAYDASTGAELWAKRYNGTGNGNDRASALGVSPDGSQVFVTGTSFGSTTMDDYFTVAYDASTGAELWANRYNGSADSADYATALGVSVDGSEVFVAGSSFGPTGFSDFATVAYDASTGAELWANRYNGTGSGLDSAKALGVSPDGSEVFVTGRSGGSTGFSDFATVAFDASTGAELWARRYNGSANHNDYAAALGVSPDGSEVFVTGGSVGSTSGPSDYATVAHGVA